MKTDNSLGEILANYLLNSEESFAVNFRKQILEKSQSPKTINPTESKNFLVDNLEDWIDNQDVMQIFHISPRTLQTLRSNGILPFSRISGKLYYRKVDIQKILSDNYKMIKIRDYGRSK